jgi:hypothetical protein
MILSECLILVINAKANLELVAGVVKSSIIAIDPLSLTEGLT